MIVSTSIVQGSRKSQQDAFLIKEPNAEGRLVSVVADGMGGPGGGLEASNQVISVFEQSMSYEMADNSRALEGIMHEANHSLEHIIAKQPELDGMGTTCVAFGIANNVIRWVSVGDSPLFLIRDKECHRLNEDHSLTPYLQQLLAFGKLSQEEYDNDRRHNSIESALMGVEIPKVDRCEDGFTLRTNDIILAASDGVETLSKTEIIEVCLGSEPGEIATNINKAVLAKEKPKQDNATVVAIAI